MMHNDDAMKNRDDRPLTKEDAKQFATKDDLKQYATKNDLAGFALETQAALKRQALAIVKTQESVDTLRADVLTSYSAIKSDLMKQMDTFMANTMRVDHDNIILVHRMDAVEGRVTNLERRAP